MSAIEWTDDTWNPVTGCDKVSPGCDHCYAEKWAVRDKKNFPNGFAVTLHPERLDKPRHWRKPRRVFVNSMSDLFHDQIPDQFIEQVWDTMAAAPQHTFQILTKRPARMRSMARRLPVLPNVWLGVSTEDQKWADVRIPVLLDTPAAVRFISAEPLLGPIDLTPYLPQLDWVIVGGESGPGHRTMNPDWARELRDQCDGNTAFLFKQWGGLRAKDGGRELDGRFWDEYPDVRTDAATASAPTDEIKVGTERVPDDPHARAKTILAEGIYAPTGPTVNGQHHEPDPEDIPPPEDQPGDGYVPPDEPTGDDQPATPRLAGLLLNRTALKDLPDPQPLIDNVLDQGTVALLYGRWGTGKSFIALDWAASVATGRNWQGRETGQRRVLYVAAEGAFGLKGRISAWETGWHTQILDDQLDILPRPVNLTNAVHVGELRALIEWNGYGFVSIDTLARCMVGADENSAKDCGIVVDNLTWLRESTPDRRGVVLGVHHTGKDGKTFRGSSVFEAGADTVYSVAQDGGLIVLDREKRKDGTPVDRHELKVDPVDGTGSAVISAHSGVVTADRADRVITIFRDHFGRIGATKAELRDAAIQSGIPSMTAYRGINDLVQRGILVNEGTDLRPFYRDQASKP